MCDAPTVYIACRAEAGPVTILKVARQTPLTLYDDGEHESSPRKWNPNISISSAAIVAFFVQREETEPLYRYLLMVIYHESAVASVILFAVVCWGSRFEVADANSLNVLIEGQWCGGGGAALSDSSVRKEDAV